jgi:CubicO group peptidase (beta-lactamase class C family)
MIKKAARLPIQFDPGTQWQYGMSTDVLGRVVEVASGRAFDTFVREEICNPLGMMETFFTVPPEKRPRVVAAYIPEDGRIEKLKLGEKRVHNGAPLSSDYHLEHNKCFCGGGGLCSTASDYMRFCQMLLNGGQLDGKRLLRKQTVEMMTADQLRGVGIPDPASPPDLIDEFGFGFTIYDEQNPNKHLRGAYAWFGFWSTSFRISPRGDWILVTMSQVAWDENTTPAWFAEYERIAAEAIDE